MTRLPCWILLAALSLALGCATKSENQRLVEELAAKNLETRLDERGVTVFVPDVLFAFDSDALSPQGAIKVKEIAEIAGRVARGRNLIAEGHTDARGTEAYNLALSLRRANRVVEALGRAGIDSGLLSAQGFGESRPVAMETQADGSDDADGRQRNRRVEVVIANRPGSTGS